VAEIVESTYNSAGSGVIYAANNLDSIYFINNLYIYVKFRKIDPDDPGPNICQEIGPHYNEVWITDVVQHVYDQNDIINDSLLTITINKSEITISNRESVLFTINNNDTMSYFFDQTIPSRVWYILRKNVNGEWENMVYPIIFYGSYLNFAFEIKPGETFTPEIYLATDIGTYQIKIPYTTQSQGRETDTLIAEYKIL